MSLQSKALALSVPQGSIDAYVQMINEIPVLSADEEYAFVFITQEYLAYSGIHKFKFTEKFIKQITDNPNRGTLQFWLKKMLLGPAKKFGQNGIKQFYDKQTSEVKVYDSDARLIISKETSNTWIVESIKDKAKIKRDYRKKRVSF